MVAALQAAFESRQAETKTLPKQFLGFLTAPI